MEEVPIIPTTLRFADIFPILIIVIVGLGVIAFWLYRKGYFQKKYVVAATDSDTDSKNEKENQLPIDVMMLRKITSRSILTTSISIKRKWVSTKSKI